MPLLQVHGLRPVSLTLAVVSMSVGACESGPSGGTGVAARLTVDSLVGNELVSGDILGLPNRITLIGGRLVVADRAGAPFLHIVDPATGAIVRSVGRTGDGPGEYRGVWVTVDRPGDDGSVWAFDVRLRRLTRVSVLDAVSEEERRAPTMIQLGPAAVIDPVWMTPTRMLAAGMVREGAFIEVDESGATGAVVGPPPPGPDDVPVDQRIAAYQGKLLARPDRRFLAKAYLEAGRIDIFDHAGSLVATADVPEPWEPEFAEPDPPGGRWRVLGRRRGYVAIAATDEYVFGVFSGVSFEEAPPVQVAGRRVDVFRWSGEYVRTLAVDVPEIITIAVDGDLLRMWVVVHEPVPAIRVYSLRGAY